eukprot:CAMPEP_0197185660 /NCGR_PEP_ID=MMETSP1423-20130617/12385_1 /TAXON_ID=476441 /ORGANISM="Pseudo-nitzschia heimii, Strain UNC1101" /LENGTH=439 /DNA_ID=CAMNT_0042636785 /DNA_START=122 /DNA_END=1441 /DNA_ORIENTATION=+
MKLYPLTVVLAASMVTIPHARNFAIAFAPASIPQKSTRSLLFSAVTENEQSDTILKRGGNGQTLPSFWSDEDGARIPQPLHESEYTQVLSTMDISPIAVRLRDAYDDHFRDPRQPSGDRFAWDPWFVAAGDGKLSKRDDNNNDDDELDTVKHTDTLDGEEEALANQVQYSLKRIQTSLFFPEEEYNILIDDLVSLANSVGLTAITPPWTSMYTDGDSQNFHTDSSHGPLAFVLSLSQKGNFRGGETMILKPEILDMWRNFETSNALECGSIIRYIPTTPLGRCIAFDPRVPHGVNNVVGTNDPRTARVVVHGWFNEPEVCWFGPWDDSRRDEAATILDESLQPLVETLGSGEIGRVVGYLAARVEIDVDGCVDSVCAVCDTIQADVEDFRGIIGYDEADRPVMEDAAGDIRLNVYEALKRLQFEEGNPGRALVVPFAFE